MRAEVSINSRREWLTAFAPLVVWIAVIFFLSSSFGATSHTSVLIRPILVFLFPSAPDETIAIYHAYVRKAAHFTEYAILGMLAYRSFALTSFSFARERIYLPAIAIVIAVASVDEFNQSFNTARAGSVYDILLDVSGGITMVVIIWAIGWFTESKARSS